MNMTKCIQFYRCLLFLFLLILVGCSGKQDAGHSHLWVGDQEINVWSYERVDSFVHDGEETIGEYVVTELESGDVVTFASGVKVQFNGTDLTIDDEVIDRKHVQVDGKLVRKNAFIKVD